MRNWELWNFAKLVFAKSCETCETNVKQRKKVFAKPCETRICETYETQFAKLGETLRNTKCRHCESCKNWVALWNYNPKSRNNTVTTARLLRVARACQGNHIEMPQLATVARALRLITEYHLSWQKYLSASASCSALLRGASREALGGTGWRLVGEGGGGGRRGHSRPRSERRPRRGAPRRSWEWGHSATQKGLFPNHLPETMKLSQYWFPRREQDSAVENEIWVKNCWVEFESNTVANLLFELEYESNTVANLKLFRNFKLISLLNSTFAY